LLFVLYDKYRLRCDDYYWDTIYVIYVYTIIVVVCMMNAGKVIMINKIQI
jgi:hypothetical protein